MKYCPSCNIQFQDSLAFCGIDGTRLIDTPIVQDHSPNANIPVLPAQASLGSELGTKVDMRPAQSRDLNVSIQLDRSQEFYYPGDVVRGTVTVLTRDAIQIGGVGAALIYQERYESMEFTAALHASAFRHDAIDDDRSEYCDKHVDEYWVSGTMVLAEGMLPANFSQTYRFELRIPDNAPPPYMGELAPVYWLIRATAFLPTGQVGFQDIALPLIVPARGQQMIAGHYGKEAEIYAEAMTMRFSLPRLEYTEGETITGQLLLAPRKDVSAQAIRVGLEWFEGGLVGNGPRNKTISEPQTQIASKTELRRGVQALFNFSLPIPTKSRPTRRSDKSRSICRITASIDIRWSGDYQASAEIFLFNGWRRE